MIRHSFKASLLALSLSISMGAHAASVQEPDIHFYPTKSWNVQSSSEDLGGVTVQKCTISNQFNNGFVIQLNGSHKWVQSMQVDFRQDAFNPGQDYDVSLSVPGIKNKKLSGKAANKSQIVINMAGQKDFYQSMRDSSVLDLKIDSNEFRFYMLNFTKNAMGFERCMAGGDIQAAQSKDSKTPTFNEAIAYEQAEKTGVPITEILPSEPRPSIEKAIEVSDVEAAEVAATRSADLRPIAETQESARPRLSQMLADEIQRNPDIADVESQAPAEPKLVEKLEAKAEREVKEVAAVDVVEAAPIVIDPVEPKAVVKPMEILKDETGLVMPPNFEARPELPKPVGFKEKEAPKDDAMAAASAITDEPIADKRALTDNAAQNKMTAMALAQLNDAPATKLKTESVPGVIETKTTSASAPIEIAEVRTPVVEMRAAEPIDLQTIEVAETAAITPMKETAALEIDKPKPVMDISVKKPNVRTTPKAEALLSQKQKTAIPESPKIKVTKHSGKIEADFSDEYVDLEPASAPAPRRATDGEMGRQLSNLQREMQLLKSENAELNAELETALTESKQEQMSISSENWNLEKVTKQYNEAERQLKRMGQQMQQERAACSVEKQELEAMLFDPSLTADAQTAKLVRLRTELDEAKDKIRMLQGQP